MPPLTNGIVHKGISFKEPKGVLGKLWYTFLSIRTLFNHTNTIETCRYSNFSRAKLYRFLWSGRIAHTDRHRNMNRLLSTKNIDPLRYWCYIILGDCLLAFPNLSPFFGFFSLPYLMAAGYLFYIEDKR